MIDGNQDNNIFKKDSLAMSLIQHIKTFKFDEILEKII